MFCFLVAVVFIVGIVKKKCLKYPNKMPTQNNEQMHLPKLKPIRSGQERMNNFGSNVLVAAVIMLVSSTSDAQVPPIEELSSTWQPVRMCRPHSAAPLKPCNAGGMHMWVFVVSVSSPTQLRGHWPDALCVVCMCVSVCASFCLEFVMTTITCPTAWPLQGTWMRKAALTSGAV